MKELDVATAALIMIADETYTGKHLIARKALRMMGYKLSGKGWQKEFTQADFQKGLMLAGLISPANEADHSMKEFLKDFELNNKENTQ